MNKRALVIRTAGDPEIAAALADGIAVGTVRVLPAVRSAAEQAEIDQTRAERDLLKTGYENRLRNEIADAHARYHFDRPPLIWCVLAVLWTLTLLGLTWLSQPRERCAR